jgi:hypothetical protein
MSFSRALILLALASLGGCADALYERVGMTEEAVLKRGQFVRAAPQAEPEPLYCYRSLGKPDCYATPQPGRADLLIGSYGPTQTQ